MHLHKVTLHSITICCIRLRCYNPTAHTVNPYCTLVISYCTFCVVLHTILGPNEMYADVLDCSELSAVGE